MTNREVYVRCDYCGQIVLIEMPDWNEPLPKCPNCGQGVYDVLMDRTIA